MKRGENVVIESAYDFHLRAKHEFYKSLVDGIDLENSAANYEFSKMNAIRHGLSLNHYNERIFKEASDFILKAKDKRGRYALPYRNPTVEASGLSKAPWIDKMKQMIGGHDNPRDSHASWPTIENPDNDVAHASISPWTLTPLLANQEWGEPAFIDMLDSAYRPHVQEDGEMTNYTKHWLIPQVIEHEKRHSKGYHNQPSYLGALDGKGNMANPQQLYSRHFYEWIQQQPKEVQDLDPKTQRDMHLAQYKKVWAGKEKDPLAPYDTGSHALGFLGYALGLEWLKPNERDAVVRHVSEHGFDPSQRMPFVNPSWVNRNWMGRYIGPEIMHRLRSQNMAGSGIPSQFYDYRNEDVKEAFKGRRLMESLKDLFVYENDIPMAGVQSGEAPIGYFNENGDFVHDPMHDESHFLISQRQRKEEQPHLIDNRTARELGLISMRDYLLNKHGNIPRHITTDDGNKVISTNHDRDIDDAFSSEDEFNDLLHQGYIDENQHAIIKEYMHEMGREFERHKEISNGIAPYINMYHHSGADEDNIEFSPYALFMSAHHGVGGHADDPTSAVSELHHIFHPDVWGRGGDGLFTSATTPTSSQFIMPLKEGMTPAEQYPEKIWPKEKGRKDAEGGFSGDEFREEASQINWEIEGAPRDSMQNLIGVISDLPKQSGSALPFHVLDGKITSWPQLAVSHDAQYHHERSRKYPTGPLAIANWETDDEGKAVDEFGQSINPADYSMSRQTLDHIMNSEGMKNEKQRALLSNLWGGWELHPADAFEPTKLPGVLEGNMKRTRAMERDLQQHALVHGNASIPGHAHTTDDMNTRIKQLLQNASVGREERISQPLPLLKPAIESFQEGLSPTKEVSSPGMSPGETYASTKETGWLDSEPGQWYLYQPTDELPETGPVDESMVRDFTKRPHFEPIQNAQGSTRTRLSFPNRQSALQALADGETECPVCNGDGKIDPEDVQKADKTLFDYGNEDEKPSIVSLFDYGSDEKTDEEEANDNRPTCPNCNGTGRHQLSQDALQSRILPSKEQHLQNVQEMGLNAYMDTPENERDEEWYDKISQLQETPDEFVENRGVRVPGHAEQTANYFTSKYLGTVDLVQNVAKSLAEQVRQQFEADGLPDPFGPDENGDYSQAHVNALALWSHANEWALRGQPHNRSWENDHIHGVEIAEDDITPQRYDKLQASSSMYYPHLKNSAMADKVQTEPGPTPLSLFNSSGYRTKYGWKMSPTFGVKYSFTGEPSILHNGGIPTADKQPFLNVPMNQLRSVFPEMQPMSRTHPSAPSADDIPEQQKMGESGESIVFNLSEDDIPASTLLKSLTNPDIIKENASIKPIKAAHRIFSFDDMKHLRGFSGDWVVSSWFDGQRILVHKQGKKVDARLSDGTKVRLSSDMRKGLIDANEDRYIADAIMKRNEIVFIDLLEHGHKELYEEPLKDRIVRLRSQFESSENVLMPAPYNTRRTDDEGLEQAIENIQAEQNDGVLLRDAISTYMKGESRHPKWVLMRDKKELDVIILNRRGSGPFMYQLGIGPINEKKAETLGNRAVQHDKKWYMDIGTISRERKSFIEGDYVRVSISSATSNERDGEEVFNIQPIKIIGESKTHATDSTESLEVMTKGYTPIIIPHDVVIKQQTVEIHIPHIEDVVIYKTHQWDNHWVLDKPISIVNDLKDSDYTVHMAESLRPFWQPVVAMSLNHLVKLDYDPRDTGEKAKGEKEDEEEHMVHEVAYEIRKPKKMGKDQILKPETTKMLTKALAMIDTYLAKESATWTGARGLGIGLGTPDSAPRGPTEITSDSNTLDYDVYRDEDESDKPKKNKATGEVQETDEMIETDEGDVAEIRVTEDEATLHIHAKNHD